MSITLEINKNTVDNDEQLNIQYLPAKFDGDDGPAKIKEYFTPYTVEGENKILRNSIRGYPLVGCMISVPKNYMGAVVQETKQPLDSDADRTFKMTGKFNEFTYWNYDKKPSKNDPFQEATEWLEISESIAQPVTNEQFDDEMKRFQAKKLKEESEKKAKTETL